MCIYKTAEPTFIKLINTKKSNVIIGAIYKYPNMDVDEYNEFFLNLLLYKTSKKRKSILLLSDFNVDLLKYDHHALTNEFLNSLSSHMFLPNIIHLTRVTSNSKTLTDNNFSNILGPDSVSGIFTATFLTIFHNSPLRLTFFLTHL